uniref:J domain-containing protein n=1 Tax=Eutreptiella gymnastica TaxID=73025 RepID=A0A7S1NBT0_9EUGL|mmetsp:Transcript_153080/g.267514  ORF Transcript_153080/g.267514 Transcript_153080/m.267514 type:complete len:231 (+) Transcript_153080:198-890(+)
MRCFFYSLTSCTGLARMLWLPSHTKVIGRSCARAAMSSTSQDPYRVLDVPRNATFPEVKKAYYQMAARYHPDRPDGGDKEKMKQIVRAYEDLASKAKGHAQDVDPDFDFHKAYEEMRRADRSPFASSSNNEEWYKQQYKRFDEHDVWRLHFEKPKRDAKQTRVLYTPHTMKYQAKVQEARRAQRRTEPIGGFSHRTQQYAERYRQAKEAKRGEQEPERQEDSDGRRREGT